MEIVIIVYIGLIGLLIGSFLNVVIYRLPHGETIVSGRSHCPVCGHNLSGLDLVPVFSFLLLGRRCRYCKAPISWRYMIVELTAGLFFTGAAIVLQPWAGPMPAVSTIAACAVFCVLLADSLIQYDGHTRLSFRMTAIALILSAFPLIFRLVFGPPGLTELVVRILGLTAGLAVMAITAILVTPGVLQPARSAAASDTTTGKVTPDHRHARMLIPTLPAAGLFLGPDKVSLFLIVGSVLILLALAAEKAKPSSRLSVGLRRLLPLLILLFFVLVLFIL